MDPLTIAMGLAKVVPEIYRWVTGNDKGADAAREIVGIAEQVTGLKGNEAAQAIQTDPTLQIQFQQFVIGKSADLDVAYLADRQNARARDIELNRAGVHNTRANAMVAMDAIGLVLGLFGMLMLGWFKAKYPQEISEGVFGSLMTQLATITSYFGLCLRDAHQFEFGSSRSSRDKDELIARTR